MRGAVGEGGEGGRSPAIDAGSALPDPRHGVTSHGAPGVSDERQGLLTVRNRLDPDETSVFQPGFLRKATQSRAITSWLPRGSVTVSDSVKIQHFLEAHYRQFTGNAKIQIIAGNYWHATLYQQSTRNYTAYGISYVHRQRMFTGKLIYLPVIATGNENARNVLTKYDSSPLSLIPAIKGSA